MKKLLLLTSMLLPAMVFAQNTYTVSNIAGVKANYTTLQGALDSVPAGSILYLLPSSKTYGSGIVKKKVVIYGNGFLLDQNGAPATNPNIYGVTVQYLDIKQGGSNSYVEGLQFNTTAVTQVEGVPTGTPLQIDSAVNVIVSRCAFFPHGGGYFVTTNTTYNCIIRDCYMDLAESGEGNSSNVLNDNNSSSTALQFRNNIITSRGAGARFFCYNILASADISFTNNTIIAALRTSDFQKMKYVNNIFVDVAAGDGTIKPSDVNMTGTVVHNNITNRKGLFDSTSQNAFVANADTLFTYSTFGFHSEDEQWRLVPGFANTYGAGGVACGAYGGENPYTLSGIPHLPNIYDVSIKPDPAVRGHVLVHIKAKATN